MTLWHLPSSRVIRTFEAGRDPVVALAFSGDGRRLAAGGGPWRGQGWVDRLGRGNGDRARERWTTSRVWSLPSRSTRMGTGIAVADYVGEGTSTSGTSPRAR